MTSSLKTRCATLVMSLLSLSLFQDASAAERTLSETEQGPEGDSRAAGPAIEEHSSEIERRIRLRREADEKWKAGVRLVELGDHANAISALERAAVLGHPDAQYFLGRMYLTGDHVDVDTERGLALVREAAQRCRADAMHAMGKLYEEGSLVRRDLVEAYEWFSRAAAHGTQTAQLDMERVRLQLSPYEADRVMQRRIEPEAAYAGGDGVTAPKLIQASKVPPEYPKQARAERVQAEMVLQVIIDIEGVPRDIRVIQSSHPGRGFEDAAIEAVRQWLYEPAELDGKPVAVYFTVGVQFMLH